MRKDASDFAKDEYFSGQSDNRSIQENSFDKLLYSGVCWKSISSHKPVGRPVLFPWITPEIRKKIRRRNRTHVKAKKTGGSKLRAKFESLRREIKAGVKKQHGLYVNTLFVILMLIPETSTGTLIVKRKTCKVSHL